MRIWLVIAVDWSDCRLNVGCVLEAVRSASG